MLPEDWIRRRPSLTIEEDQSPRSIQPAAIPPANQEEWIHGGKDQSGQPIQSAIPPFNQGHWTGKSVDISQRRDNCQVPLKELQRSDTGKKYLKSKLLI
jgi:hypothetical protein